MEIAFGVCERVWDEKAAVVSDSVMMINVNIILPHTIAYYTQLDTLSEFLF
jgi:hypothetical protein